MTSLKKLSAAVVLTFVLGVSVFAGDILTPPCAPGEISTPPCVGGQMAPDSAVPGQTSTPPASAATDATAMAISLLESLLLY
jgi:hypothetical protein